MGGSYSVSIRERAVKFVVEEGGNRDDACRVLGICADTLQRWLRKHRETGDVSAKPRGNYRTRKINIILLQQMLDKNPDATLEELSEPFDVYPSTIEYHLKRLNITRKKNHAIRGAGRRKKARV